MDDDPFNRRAKPAAGGGSLAIGQQFSFSARDKDGNVTKTFTITRTDRPYAYDLCDAYNDGLTQEQIDRGLIYIVSDNEVRLVIDSQWSVRHTRKLKEKAARGG